MTNLTEGQKATIIRAAINETMGEDMHARAPEVRNTLRQIAELPAVSLAIFYDALEHASKKGGA